MQEILAEIAQRPTKSTKFLIRLVEYIRSSDSSSEKAAKRFNDLIDYIEKNPEHAQAFGTYVSNVFHEENFIRLFTELGITSNDGFFIRTRQHIINRLLPEVHETTDIFYLMELLFPNKNDYQWVCEVSDEAWSRFFGLIGLREIYQLSSDDTFLGQILNSVQVISIRLNALGLARDIVEKLPELEYYESPFMAQSREVVHFVEHYFEDNFDRTTANKDYRQLILLLDQCEDYVTQIKKRRKVFGISLKMTNYILRLKQNIKRIRLLLYLVTTHTDDLLFKEEVHLLKDMVRTHCLKKSLRIHLQTNLSLLAYQITSHTGQSGESYITTNAKEYWKMFRAAAGGGIIVAFLSVIKVLINYVSFAPFGNAFFNSMNYSLGFITIHLTKTKLATKQPAMTASHLAVALDDTESGPEISLDALAKTIKLILRSQFIAFVGNVFLSLPVAMSIALIWQWMMGSHLATPKVANYLIGNLHPMESLVIFHGAITGVYLFLASLISGYFDNLSITERIPQRIRNHPRLRKMLPAKWLVNLSRYIENNLNQLADNFFFGIFLGSTSSVGVILGLPLDSQHITFAAANFGLSIVALDFNITQEVFVMSSVGIALIGFLNFSVSFGLSILLAIKSRNVNFKQGRLLVKKVFLLFLKNPLAFLFPPFRGTDPK
jgi:site-specific recombinase